jgi:Transposase, Mutator family
VPDSNVIKLAQPGAFTDSLTEILRSGARALLSQAVEAEVAEFLAKHTDLKTETGQQRVVRHGDLPEREIMTGIGPVAVRQPRVRDREATKGARIRYAPSILPRYARRSQSLEVLIPVLYLKGISTGDFEEALAALVGKSLPLRRQGTRQVYRRRPLPASRACPRESGGGVDRGACALAEARSVSRRSGWRRLRRMPLRPWKPLFGVDPVQARGRLFVKTYQIKYERATDCLTKDPRCPAGVLRLPCRALEALTNDEPH